MAGASSSTSLPHWPPPFTPAQISSLAASATDYSLSHGIVYRPAASPSQTAPLSTHVHHAPISLLPSPFPRTAFEQAVKLQGILNELYARVAVNDDFLTRVVAGSVAKVDDFQGGLWRIYQQVKEEGTQPAWHLGLFRSDYLLHSEAGSSSNSQPGIRQVEFNTISSSFGPLCARISQLHRFLLDQTEYYGAAADVLKRENLVRNQALELLVDGLAEAHKTYVKERGISLPEAKVLFVVQEKERNAFDQRWLEYDLLERHGIRSVRRTFTSLIISTSVSSSDRNLHLSTSEDTRSTSVEISVVYYRAGYAPTDYPTSQHWDLRLNLERSKAIKCPTVALQLAGAKKVQEVLSGEGVVASLLSSRFSESEISSLLSTWSGLYPLDPHSDRGIQGYELAMNEPQRFVMKPQREGGGNNIYRDAIPKALKEMEARDEERQTEGRPKEREGYILMELIQPPTGLGNYLIRPPAPGAQSSSSSSTGTGTETLLPEHPELLHPAECRLSPDVVSELGIYGVALFRCGQGQTGLDESHYFSLPVQKSNNTIDDGGAVQSAAYLLRTKGRESDEGGVAVGFSVLDSVVLI